MLEGVMLPMACPENQLCIPDVGVGKTGCPGIDHPAAAEVAPREGHIVVPKDPNEGTPVMWGLPACKVT